MSKLQTSLDVDSHKTKDKQTNKLVYVMCRARAGSNLLGAEGELSILGHLHFQKVILKAQ